MTIYETLGLNSPRKTQVREDAFLIYQTFIEERENKNFELLHVMIRSEFDWSEGRLKKALARLRQTEVITIVERQNKKLFKSTLYTSVYGEYKKTPFKNHFAYESELEEIKTSSKKAVIMDEIYFLLTVENETFTSKYALIKAINSPESTSKRAIKELFDEGILAFQDKKIVVKKEFLSNSNYDF